MPWSRLTACTGLSSNKWQSVSVSVRGPDSLVQVLTRERLKVIAHLRGADGWAKLTVIAPAGIVARAVPDSVNLKRKSGHD